MAGTELSFTFPPYLSLTVLIENQGHLYFTSRPPPPRFAQLFVVEGTFRFDGFVSCSQGSRRNSGDGFTIERAGFGLDVKCGLFTNPDDSHNPKHFKGPTSHDVL